MKNFIRDTILFGALISVTYFVLLVAVFQTGDPSSFFAAAIDKQQLLDTTPSPKIILVGGSSLALGIDSPTIQTKLNRPVVNMGLHGGLGLRYMMSQVRASVKSGDMVVLYPEYQQFYGFFNGDDTFIALFSVFPQGMRYLNSPRQGFNMIKKLPVSLQGQLDARLINILYGPQNSIYRRSGFDAHGDMISHLGEPQTTGWIDQPLFGPKDNTFDEEAVAVINEFAQYAHCQGAYVSVLFPAISELHYQANVAKIEWVHDRLGQSTQVDFLALPNASVLPVSYFYDSPYHLNQQGRIIRTQEMISELEDTLAQSSTPQTKCPDGISNAKK